MSLRHDNLTSLFSDIANAIRSKTGTSAELIADNFDLEIAKISGGNSSSQQLVTLWTNPSPTATFAAQKIELDLSNCAGVIIKTKNATNQNYINSTFVEMDSSFRIGAAYNGGNSSVNRLATVDSTGVTFAVGRYWNSSSGQITNSTYVIPTEILVIK